MRIALIACMVLNREINNLISESDHVVRVWWLRQGLHDTPSILHEKLQSAIHEIEKENDDLSPPMRFNAIALAYGLCSNSVENLSSALPLVIPRCDDCISLLLGSVERYQTLFSDYPGIYWFSRGWMEHAFIPSKENYQKKREEYAALYGEENADFLIESMNSWLAPYHYYAYISSPIGNDHAFCDKAKSIAEDFDMNFVTFDGSLNYLYDLINGIWSSDRFLHCPPGQKVMLSFDERKIIAAPI